jgi:hypothetical protein
MTRGQYRGLAERTNNDAYFHVLFGRHPNRTDLQIYKGKQFPQAYRGDAFIAFRGSWNRAPGPQVGYDIVFQPLTDGKPSGDYIVCRRLLRGFKDPGRATRRPSGLAVGPDGALYVSDDVKGRIWRITFSGKGVGRRAGAEIARGREFAAYSSTRRNSSRCWHYTINLSATISWYSCRCYCSRRLEGPPTTRPCELLHSGRRGRWMAARLMRSAHY